jgi:hypothetical protein
MVDVTSLDDLPPSVMDLLRTFLAATSRGEQVILVLELKSKTITSISSILKPEVSYFVPIASGTAGKPAERESC